MRTEPTTEKAKAPEKIEAGAGSICFQFAKELSRLYTYEHRKHTLKDFLTPGYFDAAVIDTQLRPWDEIEFTLGGGRALPSEATRGLAVVDYVPGKYIGNRVVAMQTLKDLGDLGEHVIVRVVRFEKVHRTDMEAAEDPKPTPVKQAKAA